MTFLMKCEMSLKNFNTGKKYMCTKNMMMQEKKFNTPSTKNETVEIANSIHPDEVALNEAFSL